MAIFYGASDSERQLLDKYSKFVKKIEDIPRGYKELEAKVEVKDVKGA